MRGTEIDGPKQSLLPIADFVVNLLQEFEFYYLITLIFIRKQGKYQTWKKKLFWIILNLSTDSQALRLIRVSPCLTVISTHLN